MARKVLNRKELRAQAEAAEEAELDQEDMDEEDSQDEDGDEGDEDSGEPKPKAKKAPPKRKSRAKPAKEVRLKAQWGVFNQTMKRVAVYDYSQKAEAVKKAEALTASQKTPHFVQVVKEPIT